MEIEYETLLHYLYTLGGCQERIPPCVVRYKYDVMRMEFVVQHGENKEAVLIFPDCADYNKVDRAVKIIQWLHAVHAYENGVALPWQKEEDNG